MFNVVKIGEAEVPMLATAAADLCYKRIFHADPVAIQAADDFDTASGIDLYFKMAYVMAMFAERKTMAAMVELTEDDFAEWLCQFDRGEFYAAMNDIKKTYEGQKVTYSDPKGEEDQPTAL